MQAAAALGVENGENLPGHALTCDKRYAKASAKAHRTLAAAEVFCTFPVVSRPHAPLPIC